MLKRLLFAACLSFSAFSGAIALEETTLTPEPGYGEIAGRFAALFPREHLARVPIDDTVAARTWTNYLASLDYDRCYFLQSDIERFAPFRSTIDDQVKDGVTGFAYQVFDVFKKRLANRCAYVEQLLARGFDLEKEESYVWKRKTAPWPRDEREWDEIWRKRIKNEYLRRVIAREPAGAAVEAREDGPPESSAEQEEGAVDFDADLSPEEYILKRYKQQLIVIEDSDAEWVLQQYLTAFAQAYDPHSSYMSPNTLEDFDIQMKLSLCGIGALLRAEDGAAKIVRIIPGGPADHDKRPKRLKPGDMIVAVAQDEEPPVDILHWPLSKIVRLIRGAKGTRVVLTVIPASDPAGATVKKVDLIRDEVRLEEQAASGQYYEVPGFDSKERNLGVVRLPAFYADMPAASRNETDYKSSANDVRGILEEMNARGVDGILLDLRNNGGGSLLEAVRLTGLFITSGPTVQVRERFGIRALPDTDADIVYKGPLVVLVNRISASASEILAGALQDYGRAVIVGDTKTHGKGTVQSVMQLSERENLGAIKVTTTSYYRISGGSTQLKGVLSDIVIPSPWDVMEVGEETLDNAMPWTRVRPADYQPVADLRFVVSDLRHKSLKRRVEDPRYDAYQRLLNRIHEMNESKTLPLNLNERKRLAETEKELADIQQELQDADQDDQGDERENLSKDLVLSEAAAVLADLVALHEKLGAMPRPEHQEMKSSTEILGEWLRDLL